MRKTRTSARFSRHDCADYVDEFAGGGTLDEVARGASADYAFRIALLRVRCEDENAQSRRGGDNLAEKAYRITATDRQIDQQEIRAHPTEEVRRAGLVVSHCNEREIWLASENSRDPFAD